MNGIKSLAKPKDRYKVLVFSSLFFFLFIFFWQIGTNPSQEGKSEGLPRPLSVVGKAWEMASNPFYDKGMNDKGIGLQLLYSLWRLAVGYCTASLIAIFLGVMLGLYPVTYRALNPYIQILRPISPLAWMPLFLYTIKSSSWAAAMVIFMSSLWPTLANTAFGVSNIKRDYLNVSAILQLSWLRRVFKVVLPAAAPAIVAGLRISVSSAWIAIVAAEMLIGGTGVGYFVWNEWNNLQLTSVIFAILMIGLVGVLLDACFGRLAKMVTYTE